MHSMLQFTVYIDRVISFFYNGLWHAGVAEWFRRQPAELFYKGSIPFPSSTTESLYSGDIIDFLWHLKKQGYKDTSIKESYSKILKNIAKNCDLNNPDAVNEFVARKHVSCCRKELIVNCYKNYCKYRGLCYNLPRYKRVNKIHMFP
jgi:hypothetical protein